MHTKRNPEARTFSMPLTCTWMRSAHIRISTMPFA